MYMKSINQTKTVNQSSLTISGRCLSYSMWMIRRAWLCLRLRMVLWTWHRLVTCAAQVRRQELLKNNNTYVFFSQKAINDSFRHASVLKWEKEKSMMDKLDYTQFKLFLRILRMTYNFYEVRYSTCPNIMLNNHIYTIFNTFYDL